VTLERTAARLGYDFGLLREVIGINDEAGEVVARIVEEAVWNLEGKRIALLGVAFKAGTDDVRSAPALTLARTLLAAGATLAAWDPLAAGAAALELPELSFAARSLRAVVGANCAVVCTEWPELARLDLPHLAGAMAEAVLVDARNAVDPDAARDGRFSATYPIGGHSRADGGRASACRMRPTPTRRRRPQPRPGAVGCMSAGRPRRPSEGGTRDRSVHGLEAEQQQGAEIGHPEDAHTRDQLHGVGHVGQRHRPGEHAGRYGRDERPE